MLFKQFRPLGPTLVGLCGPLPKHIIEYPAVKTLSLSHVDKNPLELDAMLRKLILIHMLSVQCCRV